MNERSSRRVKVFPAPLLISTCDGEDQEQPCHTWQERTGTHSPAGQLGRCTTRKVDKMHQKVWQKQGRNCLMFWNRCSWWCLKMLMQKMQIMQMMMMMMMVLNLLHPVTIPGARCLFSFSLIWIFAIGLQPRVRHPGSVPPSKPQPATYSATALWLATKQCIICDIIYIYNIQKTNVCCI